MFSVEVVDHDDRWAQLAEDLMAELRTEGGSCFSDVEHLGSTAVPGLLAKPIIDLMAPVPDLLLDARAERVLQDLGYARTPVGMPNRLFYVRVLPSGRSAKNVHLHLVLTEDWDTKNERLFRDHLLHHPDVAAAYGRLKRRLARGAGHVDEYTRAKTTLIQQAVDAERAALGLPPTPVWEE